MSNGQFSTTQQPRHRRSGETQSTRLKAAMPGIIDELIVKASRGDVTAAAALIQYTHGGNK